VGVDVSNCVVNLVAEAALGIHSAIISAVKPA